jgi:hypothetical protein
MPTPPYIPPMLPTVATRADVAQQITRHMHLMAQHPLSAFEEKMARETLSRCQNYLFERRGHEGGSEQPHFEGWGIGPLRFCTYQVPDLAAYARTKVSLATNLGADALKRVANPGEAPSESPAYRLLTRYLDQFSIERERGGYIITFIDGPALEDAETQRIETLLAEAAMLTPLGRAECARRMALMTA